jgi:hypothetical protein
MMTHVTDESVGSHCLSKKNIGIAIGGRENMHKKISSRLSAALSASQGKRKYVLEDVSWVPISNCKSGHSSSGFVGEFCEEKLVAGKASSSGDFEIIAICEPIGLMIHLQQELWGT